ncbi:hypothetical protein BBP00_00008969 [Phytophthora kernoviae]|uniref:Protein kinase domain-containing protein n=1 Tax=Phytophthora kernoviae TaxID=325452 RepID=A0A3F2RDZ5_9STRA|nr:hypothetical protein BBP00_00008969 [Phytophthora kernoviae]
MMGSPFQLLPQVSPITELHDHTPVIVLFELLAGLQHVSSAGAWHTKSRGGGHFVIAMIRQRYRLKKKLANALYGTVCLCEDTYRNNEPVAIKQASLELVNRLLHTNRNADNPWRERRAIITLLELPPHPNVVNFREGFLHNESWFVVMEYCPEGDLLERVQRSSNRRLPEAEALHLFREIVRGLHFLHVNGIAHRDVSLENILLRDGVCKISDFGLTIDADRMCSGVVGKAYYMAPEVAEQDKYDPKSADMWSLGILLFVMFSGSPLVQRASGRDNDFSAFQQLGVHGVIETWKMTSFISVAVRDLMAALLQCDPTKRLTTAEMLANPLLQ